MHKIISIVLAVLLGASVIFGVMQFQRANTSSQELETTKKELSDTKDELSTLQDTVTEYEKYVNDYANLLCDETKADTDYEWVNALVELFGVTIDRGDFVEIYKDYKQSIDKAKEDLSDENKNAEAELRADWNTRIDSALSALKE